MYNSTCTYNSKYNSQCPLSNMKRRKQGQMKLNYKYLHCYVKYHDKVFIMHNILFDFFTVNSIQTNSFFYNPYTPHRPIV